MSPANPHADRRAALLPLAKAVLHLSFVASPVANAIDSFREVGKALNKDARPPERALWEETFALAVADALPTSEVEVHADAADLAEPMADLLAEAFAVDAGFGEAELIDPTNFSAYVPVRQRFPDFVRRIYPTYDADTNAEALRTRLDVALRRALVRAWSADVARYQPVIRGVQGPIAENFRRERQWQRHNDWIRSEFYDADVFSFEKQPQPVKLKDVYIFLRCVWHEEGADAAAAEESELNAESGRRRQRAAHVAKLHDYMHAWLASPRTGDTLRLVAGGPGSGKSSFARAFATEVTRATGWRVVFVPLQRVDLEGDLLDALRKLWDRTKHQEMGFEGPGDPLDWYGQGTAPCLLIFDGLDELAHSEHAATDLTSRFIHQLEKLLRDCASSKAPLKALVLGRTVAAGEARRAAGLALATLLHVLPLRPPTASDLWLTEEHPGSRPGEDVVDDQGLLKAEDVDQRKVYWRQWQEMAGAAAEPEPPGLTDERLSGLTDEPLLLHLLIISGFLAPDRWQEAADNRNRVYAEIFSRVYERDRDEGKGVAPKVDRHGFFMLIECLGLASWPGGGRTFTAKAFRDVRESHIKGPGSRELKEMPDTDAGTLVQFYAREDFDAAGYEFLHKSFGEYLIGRGLLTAARRARRTLDEDGPGEAARHWVKIAGLAEITPEILQFLRDQVRLMETAEAQELKGALETLMRWTLREGMPAQSVGDTSSFRLIEARQRCAEGALLAVLNACARRLGEGENSVAPVVLDWPDRLALKRLLERLRLGRSPFALATVFEGLARRDAADDDKDFSHSYGHRLDCVDLSCVWLRDAALRCASLFRAALPDADLSGADLSRADLSRADLRRSNLRGASLFRAALPDADLSRADLSRADLTGAALRDADLNGAILFYGVLRGAALSRADLSGADLTGADLTGAALPDAALTGSNFRCADLSRTDLRGTDLSRTVMSGAALCGAALRGADLSGADLSGADLSGASLCGTVGMTQAQIDAARGSVATRLPEGLFRPARWKDEVRRVGIISPPPRRGTGTPRHHRRQ
jgi:uncharacterized protein YjbI with pentapeptide repeats